MKKKNLIVAAYSITHFAVDFACCYLIFGALRDRAEIYTLYLLYNFFAFAMQLPLGIIADKTNRNGLFALFGCTLVAVSYLLCSFVPGYVTVTILGLGNGAFHIGGGIDVLNLSDGRAAPLGVFVSPGAFGLYLGKICAVSGDNAAILSGVNIPAAIPLTVFLLGLLCAAVTKGERGFISDNTEPEFGKISAGEALAAICFFIVVLLRAYFGLVMNFGWKSIPAYGFMLTCAVVLGKTVGGFLSDKFGSIRTSAVSLLLSGILFLLCENPVCGIAAVFLFNMTMPITLWHICKIFDRCKGFAFGLLTFSMFIGLIPAYFGYVIYGGALFAACAAVSAAVLILGLKAVGEEW